MTTPAIDRDYLIQTLQDLIGINSINPDLVPGGAGEAEIAGYVEQACRALGLHTTMLAAHPHRPSVVARLPGTGTGKSLLLNAHLDTVGIAGMSAPFSAVFRAGRVYGRGAYDMKGSLAACLTAMKALVEANVVPAGEVMLTAVADEEYASRGTAEVLQQFRADGAIVTEPTELQLCLAHKGFVWLEVETIGRAAHGSRFQDGIDANMNMGRFLAELGMLEAELRQQRGHPLTGPPSLHAARLQGGTAWSTYAANCRLQIERRTIPGETTTRVMTEIEAILARLSQQHASFQARLGAVLSRDPFEVSPRSELVVILTEAATRVMGKPPAMIGMPFWMDSALLAAAGIETVVIGPTGAGAHAEVEWVELQSLMDLAQILVHAAMAYCR
ncbi:MAG: ArgE/DapE family deacylase [candidate division KSB1 bacterium]|nr:ArgE/DapE family deacylase [candidate division KSB1 bacterium]MDZ7274006.1 ArgE/DapE family deacylase [candidate division KSB1 bacterium]MDZ7286379.1 ArgE/DapE family deacylase [candidate division KSB1 bacterium]MDZ7296607.1 ArgE/DapE family deacylase [candidate division KSB1 bacterium]MDZ7309021.1 ArgE/DapE family deacylase [candidate division KSB1 bacterium]